jgi:hypothetical protein
VKQRGASGEQRKTTRPLTTRQQKAEINHQDAKNAKVFNRREQRKRRSEVGGQRSASGKAKLKLKFGKLKAEIEQ